MTIVVKEGYILGVCDYVYFSLSNGFIYDIRDINAKWAPNIKDSFKAGMEHIKRK